MASSRAHHSVSMAMTIAKFLFLFSITSHPVISFHYHYLCKYYGNWVNGLRPRLTYYHLWNPESYLFNPLYRFCLKQFYLQQNFSKSGSLCMQKQTQVLMQNVSYFYMIPTKTKGAYKL